MILVMRQKLVTILQHRQHTQEAVMWISLIYSVFPRLKQTPSLIVHVHAAPCTCLQYSSSSRVLSADSSETSINCMSRQQAICTSGEWMSKADTVVVLQWPKTMQSRLARSFQVFSQLTNLNIDFSRHLSGHKITSLPGTSYKSIEITCFASWLKPKIVTDLIIVVSYCFPHVTRVDIFVSHRFAHRLTQRKT